MDQEYFSVVQEELLKRKDGDRFKECETCRRKCGQTPEETVECLANLLTIEYLLDHC